MTIRHLRTAFRWLPCELCGSNESERIEIDTGDGTRVLCVHVAACERRFRHRDVLADRSARRRRDTLVALGNRSA